MCTTACFRAGPAAPDERSRGNLVFSELGVVAEMGVISFKGVWGSFGYGLEVYVITVT